MACFKWRIVKVAHAGLLEIAVYNLDELLLGVACMVAFGRLRLDEVRPDVVFKHDREEAVHGTSAAGDLLQYVNATLLFLERTFDCINLATNATHAIQ